ncbi:MAG TPA: NAD-dependent epimerase/dehydratase family protein [Terriglobales bacterium]|nr:NAD-dependent epimerase/dehydratase family protein [Terriglobales bacterium]
MSPPAASPVVLITGGAGFLGSHLADRLLGAGYRVRLLDCLDPQVHPNGAPAYLAPEAELQVGSVLDPAALDRALAGVGAVVHFAAVVGVGQSHYQIARYNQVNLQGTAVLLEALLRRQRRPGCGVERLLLAGSMSIYGEGRYRCPACGPTEAAGQRSLEQLRRQDWELRCSGCLAPLQPRPTEEAKPPRLNSMYALTKSVQEEMCRLFGRTYGLPTVVLRFFNTYGPRQALANPYTGVAAVFASALLAGRAPQVFEDGQQQRDLVSVHDVAAACQLALAQPGAANGVFNIASGQALTVAEFARQLARALGVALAPAITGQFRLGDARHCLADIAAARARLGYQPQVDLATGMRELAAWLRQHHAVPQLRHARAATQEHATAELRAFGLTG